MPTARHSTGAPGNAGTTIRLGASELVSGERLQLDQLYHAGLARADVLRLQRQFAEAP